MNKLHLTDIDIVTFLKYKGYNYKTTVQNNKVVFIFDDPDGKLAELIEEYPTSDVNRILAIYHGLHKTVRSILRNAVDGE